MDMESVNRIAGEHLYAAIHKQRRHDFDAAEKRINRAVDACDALLGPNDWIARERKIGLHKIVVLEVRAMWH